MNVLLGNNLALVSSCREAPQLSPHLGFISPCLTLLYINTLAGIHLSLGIFEKIFYGLGMFELFVKVSQAVGNEHLPLYKKEYNGIAIISS